jgi:hypothetical protein
VWNCALIVSRRRHQEDRDTFDIYLAHGSAIDQVSVWTVWTSRLVINYLKIIGAPTVYRHQTWGSGTVHVLYACVFSS